MKNMKKNGFTIVELVIVIAVIAILAAVLIPTFSGVVARANASAAQQTATNALKAGLLMVDTAQLPSGTLILVDFDKNANSNPEYGFKYNGNELVTIANKSLYDENGKVKTDNYSSGINYLFVHSDVGEVTVESSGIATDGLIQTAIKAVYGKNLVPTNTTGSDGIHSENSDNGQMKVTIKDGTKTYSLIVVGSTDIPANAFIFTKLG